MRFSLAFFPGVVVSHGPRYALLSRPMPPHDTPWVMSLDTRHPRLRPAKGGGCPVCDATHRVTTVSAPSRCTPRAGASHGPPRTAGSHTPAPLTLRHAPARPAAPWPGSAG